MPMRPSYKAAVRLACCLAAMIFSAHNLISADDMRKVSASYTYIAPENITLEQAKRTALDRARIEAMEQEFGTIVTRHNATAISNVNGSTDTRFISVGGSEVRGEWVETIGQPKYDIDYSSGQLVVTVTVAGYVRPVDTSRVEPETFILRNGTELKFASSEFRDGDYLYLNLKTPVDGWLTVWLLDETEAEAYCLLPYVASGDGAYAVSHDKSYTFFSRPHAAPGETSQVDEFELTATGVEFNDLHIVFSPARYSRPAASAATDAALPRSLSAEAFHKWLASLRRADSRVVDIVRTITITND